MSATSRGAAVAALVGMIVVPAEGLRQKAYLDPPGIWTICYGSTHNVKAGQVADMAECRARLTVDINNAMTAVERCAPGLPVHVLAAFSDAAFNLGPRIACDTATSTAARLLLAKHYEAACRQLPRWDKARVAGVMMPLPGLTKRRWREQFLCLEGRVPTDTELAAYRAANGG